MQQALVQHVGDGGHHIYEGYKHHGHPEGQRLAQENLAQSKQTNSYQQEYALPLNLAHDCQRGYSQCSSNGTGGEKHSQPDRAYPPNIQRQDWYQHLVGEAQNFGGHGRNDQNQHHPVRTKSPKVVEQVIFEGFPVILGNAAQLSQKVHRERAKEIAGAHDQERYCGPIPFN